MTQRTAKRAVEALYWLHNNEHHEVGTDWNGDYLTHVWFRNHFDKLRVPADLAAEMWKHVKLNTRKFDTRMYALKPSGKRLIGEL